MAKKAKLYKYEPLDFYPHMGPRDAHIWNKFVWANPDKFETCLYDVRVGPLADAPEHYAQNVRDAWNDLVRGRVDVIAENKDAIYIIEVKPRARGGAIGQAIHNRELYLDDHPTDKRVVPAICTDVVLPGTRAVAGNLGVTIFALENDKPDSL